MATAPVVARLQPPANEAPMAADSRQHSQAWQGFFQSVSDQMATLPARVRQGVTDGSDAAAGDIGEYLSASGGPVSLPNNINTNIASVDLTAGDWDVSGNVVFSAGAGSHLFFGAGIGANDTFTAATFPSTALNQAISTAVRRYNVTGTTTVWTVAVASFTGTMTATGTIRARRMR